MDCQTCREILSAALDGEASAAERRAAAAHCRACADCAAFAEAVADLPERVAFEEAAPDVAPRVLTAARVADEDGQLWRLGLVFVAVAQLLAAAVHVGGVHAARDQAAWEAALAFGFAWAAWRPTRAAGLVPMASVLSVLLLVNGGVSAGAGGVHHLLAPLGTAFLVLATRRGAHPRRVAV